MKELIILLTILYIGQFFFILQIRSSLLRIERKLDDK